MCASQDAMDKLVVNITLYDITDVSRRFTTQGFSTFASPLLLVDLEESVENHRRRGQLTKVMIDTILPRSVISEHTQPALKPCLRLLAWKDEEEQWADVTDQPMHVVNIFHF